MRFRNAITVTRQVLYGLTAALGTLGSLGELLAPEWPDTGHMVTLTVAVAALLAHAVVVMIDTAQEMSTR
ncbi:MAG: hypothetical protein OXF27_07570 [Acidobacteria bacterium]|nr:hypothetical protein [Acidobacteriota bacterium]